MSGLGELIKLFIYALLAVPPLIIIILLILNKKPFLKKGLILLSISLIPITIIGYIDYSNHVEAELNYVGTYNLTEYPNYDFCILILNKDNTYSISSQNNIIERGKWKYRSGGDYWIVDIGKNGQLGAGNYKYKDFQNNLNNQ